MYPARRSRHRSSHFVSIREIVADDSGRQINNHRRPNPLLSTSEGILVLSTRATNNPQFNPFAPSVPQFPLSPLALQAHLSKFGSLRSFRIIPNSSARIDRIGEQGDGEVFVVEFFDERDTERAMRAWSGLQIGGVEVLASYGVENDQVRFSFSKFVRS